MLPERARDARLARSDPAPMMRPTPLRAWLTPLAYALVVVATSANALARYVGGWGLLLYSIGVIVGVVTLWQVGPRLAAGLPARVARWGTVALVAGLVGVLLVGYPLVAEGALGPATDRDEALDLAATRLMAGQYPYYATTYLHDNPITPMPGALLLAAPFVVLGGAVYQSLLWLPLFLLVVRRWLLDESHTFLFLVSLLLLAPKVAHEWVIGGDFLANTFYVLVAGVALGEAGGRGKQRWGLAAALLLGITLSSRANFGLLLPLLVGLLARRSGARAAVRYGGWTLAAFAAVTLPFWLYDPVGFSPLHTTDKLAALDPFVGSGAGLALVALAGGVALWRATRQSGRWADFFRDAALVQGIPIFGTIFLPPLFGGPLLWYYGTRYGMPLLLLASLAFWLRLAARQPASAPTLTLPVTRPV